MGGQFSHIENTNDSNLLFPNELLDKLVQYLSTGDKLSCRLVCEDWNSYLSQTKWLPEVQAVIEDIDDATDNLTGTWSSFYFKNNIITRRSMDFWRNYSELITSLHFDNTCISIVVNFESNGVIDEEKSFLGCPHLKNLAVTRCDQYFMMGSKMVQLHKLFNLSHLEKLNLAQNKYLNDSILFSLLLYTKGLKSLNLTDCPITFTNAVFRRFYPGVEAAVSDLSEFTDNILSFQMFELSYLATPRSSSLKELIINCTRIDSDALLSFSDPEQYSWTSLSLRRCTEIKVRTLIEFLSYQTNLESLELEKTKISLEESNTLNFANLKRLCLEECDLKSIQFLEKCTKLRELNLNFNVPTEHDEFSWKSLAVLKDLRVLKLRGTIPFHNLMSDEHMIVSVVLSSMIPNFPYLMELDIGKCGAAVSDELVQIIIANCKLLRSLKLCKAKITDFGTTGQCITNNNCNGCECDTTKHTAQKMPSKNESNSTSTDGLQNVITQVSSVGHSLSELPNLKILSLSNCIELGDGTWKTALNLPYLINLDLSFCTQLSKKAIYDHIIRNCGSLEEINLTGSGLHITGDEEVFFKLRNLPRIRRIITTATS